MSLHVHIERVIVDARLLRARDVRGFTREIERQVAELLQRPGGARTPPEARGWPAAQRTALQLASRVAEAVAQRVSPARHLPARVPRGRPASPGAST